MAGIYIHIPFCKQACHYCDFHFSTTFDNREKINQAICKELVLKKNILKDQKIETVYIGGGTPSLLNKKELLAIFDSLHQHYDIGSNVEFTIECNPDDINEEKTIFWTKVIGINRCSIGIQSFQDEDLLFMNRAHDSNQALNGVKILQQSGITNISIDLIYGSQTTTNQMWINNILTAIELQVPHLSIYGLTVENRTALHHFIENNKYLPLSEEKAVHQFYLAKNMLEGSHFEHYEISNYSKSGFYSKHNSNYWNNIDYLGIGPSGHSKVNNVRSWNISNNKKYIEQITEGIKFIESETLGEKDVYHEYLLTNLRRIQGISIEDIDKFQESIVQHFNKEIKPLISEEVLVMRNNRVFIASDWLHMTDHVTKKLFL